MWNWDWVQGYDRAKLWRSLGIRPVTLSDFLHLYDLGHSMSALCTISCLLSDQGLKIPKSDLFVYELKPVSVYRCTPAVISPSLDLLFIRISQNLARGQKNVARMNPAAVLYCTVLYCTVIDYTVLSIQCNSHVFKYTLLF